MNLLKKIKEGWDSLDKTSDGLVNFQQSEFGCLFSLVIWLISPAIFYLLGLFLFDSHRIALFFCMPLGFLVNFIFKKLVRSQAKILIILIVLGVLSWILVHVFYILYGIIKGLGWVWDSLPN